MKTSARNQFARHRDRGALRRRQRRGRADAARRAAHRRHRHPRQHAQRSACARSMTAIALVKASSVLLATDLRRRRGCRRATSCRARSRRHAGRGEREVVHRPRRRRPHRGHRHPGQRAVARPRRGRARDRPVQGLERDPRRHCITPSPNGTGRGRRHAPPRLSAAAAGQPLHHRHQRVDLLAGVVERQRRPHGGLEAEAAQDRLGAVVAGAHGDAFAGSARAPTSSVLVAVEHERQHAGLLGARCRSGAGPGSRCSACGGVLEQLVLVAGDVVDADALDVVDARRPGRRRRRCCRCRPRSAPARGW